MKTIDTFKKSKGKRQYFLIFPTKEKKTKTGVSLGRFCLSQTAGNKNVFSKGDAAKLRHDLFTITRKLHDTIPSYRIKHLPDRCNEKSIKTNKMNL